MFKNMIGKSFIQLRLYVHERKEIGHMVICLCLFLHHIMTACKIAIKYTVTSKILCNTEYAWNMHAGVRMNISVHYILITSTSLTLLKHV